MVITSYNGCAN